MRLKELCTAVFRVVGVCALAVGLVLLVLALENTGAAYPAQVISVGTRADADCTVILSNNSCVMIDTGELQDGNHILQLLRQHQVQRIDLLILTHPDKDHVGSAALLLDHFEVGTVVLPYYSGSKAAYDALVQKMEAANTPVLTLSRDRLFTISDLKIRVFPPEKFYYDEANNYSLATLVEHGAVRMFFAGDAQAARAEELLALDIGAVDLYKVAYHGRDTRLGGQLIEALAPQYAIVNAARAEQGTQAALEAAGAQVVFAVRQDHVFVSDGAGLAQTE